MDSVDVISAGWWLYGNGRDGSGWSAGGLAIVVVIVDCLLSVGGGCILSGAG